MPSVVGLLEQLELAARRRVDELREEADRVQAELAVAEWDWKEWVIARSGVGEVLDPVNEPEDHDQTERTEETPSVTTAAKPTSQVPMWREGLGWSVLSVDCQRIGQALADCHRLHQGPLTRQEMAVLFEMDAVPARWRHCGRRRSAWCCAAGWPSGSRAGSRSPRACPGQAAGHEHRHRSVDHRLGSGGGPHTPARDQIRNRRWAVDFDMPKQGGKARQAQPLTKT